MTEATLLQAALVLPVGAAIFAMLLLDSPSGRAVPTIVIAAAAACMAAAAVFDATGTQIEWQRFQVDAWRGLLAAGALAGAAASMRHATGVRAANAIGGGVAAAAIVAPDVLWLGLLLLVSTAAFATGLAGVPDTSALRRVRVLAPLLASDALAIAGLTAAAGTTLAFEPMSTVAGSLLLAAAALRLVPLPATAGDAMRTGATPLVFGPVRAHGALLAAIAVAGAPTRGLWLLAIGALVAAIASVRLIRDPAPEALLIVPGAIAAAGIGLGGPVAIAGAALTLAVAFAAVMLLDASGEPTLATPLASFAPAGGALLGFGLAGGALWRLAAGRAEFMPAAIALALAATLCAVAAWRAAEYVRVTPGVAGAWRFARPWVVTLLSLPALGVAGVAAFAPAFAANRVGSAIALAAGAAPALIVPPESPAEGLGIAVAALALAGLLAGAAPRQTMAPATVVTPRWMRGWAAPWPAPPGAPTRGWTMVAAIGGGVAVVSAIRLILIAGGRGWL